MSKRADEINKYLGISTTKTTKKTNTSNNTANSPQASDNKPKTNSYMFRKESNTLEFPGVKPAVRDVEKFVAKAKAEKEQSFYNSKFALNPKEHYYKYVNAPYVNWNETPGLKNQYDAIPYKTQSFYTDVGADKVQLREQLYAHYMKPSERRAYNVIYATRGSKDANSYLEKIYDTLLSRRAEEITNSQKKMAKDRPGDAAAISIMQTPINFAGMVNTAGAAVRGEDVNINSPMHDIARSKSAISEGLTEDKGTISSLLISTGLSMGDMLVSLPFGRVGSLAILSSNAASSAAYDATKRGASAGEALGVGVTAGLIEALTEKIGIERWFRIAKMPPTTRKKAISTIAKQAGVEGVEELISEVLNNIADSAIMDEKSNYNRTVNNYISNGMSEDKAKSKAIFDLYVLNPLMSGLGGMLSGGVMGTGSVALGKAGSSNIKMPPATEVYGPTKQNIDIKTPPSTEIAKNGPVKTTDVNSAIERIVNGTATNKDIDLFKPANVQNRVMFEAATGVKLPSTNSEVRHYLRDYAKNQAVGTENVKTDNLTMPGVESVPNVQNNVDDNIQGNLNILSKIANKYPVNVISPQQTEVTAEGQNITLNNPLQNNLNNSNNNDIINIIGGMNDVRTDSNSSGQERGTIESASKQSTPIPEWRQFGNKRINEFVRISNEQYGSKEIYGGNGEKITYTSSAGNTQKSDAEILVRNEGKKCGVDVEYATDLTVTLKDGKIVRPLAFSDGNKVVLSDRATFKDAAHEFSHEIKRKNPQKYETVKTYIKNNMDTGLYGFMLEDYINEYSEIYGFDKNNLTESQLDIIEEELICDIAAYNKIGANTTMPNEAEFTEVVNEYYNENSSDASNELKSELSKKGISFVEYESGNQRQRNDIVNSFEDVKFSVKNSDTDYLKAVESGDMETAQRMVDEVAKANGYNIHAYHGTRRGDRVGNVFLPERATSGPMAFFTDNKEIAENYAKSKQDTSMAYDPDYDSYETQFRIKMKNGDIPLYRAWGYLSFDARNRITQKAQQLREDWDGDNEFILDPNNKEANGGFQWQMKEARGNTLLALNEQWLNSGTLFNEENRFLEVLEMAGVMEEFKKIGEIYFKDPNARHEKVYDTYLRITNPFDTAFADDSFVDGLLAWYEEQDETQYERENMESDLWDKNGIDAYEFADRVKSDIESGTFHAWTSIPDSVTDYLKSLGYDGIKDLGGKNSDVGHTVWIPFSSEQVKSSEPVTYDDNGKVIPLSERFNKQDNDIRYSFDRGKKSPDYYQQKYSEYLEQYGTIEKGMQPRLNNAEVPRKTGNNQYVSNFARTMAETDGIANAMDGEFEKMVVDGTMSHERFTNKAAEREATQRIENIGFEGAVNEFETLVNSGRVNKNDIAMGQILLNVACQNKNVEVAKRLAVDLSVAATQFGQNVQAFSMLKRMSPDGQLYYLEKSLQKINQEILDKYKGEFKEIEIDSELAKNLLNAKDEKEINEAVYAIEKNIGEQIPATKMDKWNAWRYLAMLGNTRTHFRNVFGNAVFAPARGIKNVIGAGFEKALPKAERTKSLTKTKESKDFAENDWNLMADVVKGNEGKYGTRRGIEEHRKIFKTKWLEAARKFNTNALEVEDGWFLEPAYKSAFAQAMTARGLSAEYLNSGTKQANEDLQRLREYAINEAQRATYRDSNAFSEMFKNIGFRKTDVISQKAADIGNIFVEGVLPFKKTPANILVRGVEYSPVGLIKGMTYDLYQVKKGNISAAKAIDNISSGLTGTAIVGLGAFLAHLGALVVSPDEDDEVAGYKKMLGAQNYALRIGDHMYTIDWMSPTAMSLFVGAEIIGAFKDTDNFNFKTVTDALTRISEPAFELSCLSGIQSALESIQYSKGNIVGDLLTDMISSYVTQALPTIGGQVARTIDNTQRNIYYKDKTNGVPQVIQGIINKAMSKVPGLTYFLPEKVDRWGRVQKYGSLPERAFENFVSPGYYSNNKSTWTDNKLMDLYEKTGDDNVLPDVAAKNFKVNGETNYLTAEEYIRFSKERGQLSYKYVTEFLKKPTNLDDETKVDIIKAIYEYSNAKAKEKVSDYELPTKYNNVDKAFKRGMSPAVYYYNYYRKKSKK